MAVKIKKGNKKTSKKVLKKKLDGKIERFKFNLLWKSLLENKKRTVLIIITLLVTAFVLNRTFKQPSGITTETVVKKTLKKTINANGEVKAKKFANVKFEIPGKVSYLSVAKGDKVKEYQLLASLSSVSLNANYQKALNDFRNATANVESILDTVQGHEDDETFAQRALRTDAEVRRDNAYQAIRSAQDALSKISIYSPITGFVVDTNDLLPGLTLTNADLESKFITVVDLDSMYFSVNLDEIDYQFVTKGQEVEVTVDAYPNYTCKGVVDYVGQMGEETLGGVITVPVEVEFTRCFIDLVTGFNGQAEFITTKKENVLAIPKNYLVNENGSTKVLVQKGKNTRTRELVEIKLGMETVSEVEVTSGLQEGDIIVYVPVN